tara:strand:+ start:594 stop:848 length:255 start_codon:yes stop_codon:yes gene_type:complete
MKYFALSYQLHFVDGSPPSVLGLPSTIIYSFASGSSSEEVISMHRDTKLLKLDNHCVKKIIFLGCVEITDTNTLSLLHEGSYER